MLNCNNSETDVGQAALTTTNCFVCSIIVRGSLLCQTEAASRFVAVQQAVDAALKKLLSILCPEAADELLGANELVEENPSQESSSSNPITSGENSTLDIGMTRLD